MELYRIKTVESSDNFSPRLTYDDDCFVLADFAKLIRKGDAFAALGSRSFFRRVKLRKGGREVAWPGEIDFCADALRLNGRKMRLKKRGNPRARRGGTEKTDR